MDDARAEFWGDLQMDFYRENSALFLANQSLEDILRQDGKKVHKPLLSHPQTGTYTPHTDITFQTKKAESQELSVDTFKYAAEDIDDTEKGQTPYDLPGHSLKSIRRGMMDIVEQKYLSEIANAYHKINSGNSVAVSSVNVLDIIEEAEGRLGAADAPTATAMRAMVMGPRTMAKLRRSRADRETKLGDYVAENGVMGAWLGWTPVQNNNLPWSATLNIATNPANGDTITIQGVTLEFQDNLANVTAGNVGVLRDGSTVATSRANLEKAIEDLGTAGTHYTQMSILQNFMLRRKAALACTTASAMAFTGYGDISVSSDLTATADGWTNQIQKSVFMVRGSIDLVVQINELETMRKEKGFADLVKGLVGVGSKVFQDGSLMMVELVQDASGF